MTVRDRGQHSDNARFLHHFVGAGVCGPYTVFSCFILWRPGETADPCSDITLVLSALLLGCFVSGRIVSPVVRRRRGQFFYLVASSPAFWIWCLIVFFLFFGETSEVGGREFVAMRAACVFPAAGALAADWMRHRSGKGRHEPVRRSEPTEGSASGDPAGLPSDPGNQ